MSVWSSYPFLRITAFFAVGIVTYPIVPNNYLLFSATLLILFVFLKLIFKKPFRNSHTVINGFVIVILCFFLGMGRMGVAAFSEDENHLLNVALSDGDTFVYRINSYQREKTKHIVYEGELLSIISTKVNFDIHEMQMVDAKVMVYLSKDSVIEDRLIYGDLVVTNRKPLLIAPPSNPYEFDYRNYKMKQGVSHQVFLKNQELMVVGNQPKSYLLQQSYRLRRYFSFFLNRHLRDTSTKGIALALVLGIKDGLDKDLKSAYSSAGAMHILAVSGLHVGIIHMIVTWLLGFLRRWKTGKFLFVMLSLFLLWSYAFITGLSPSVLRAAIMFSVIVIGDHTMRNHNIYNSMAISAFFILVFDPFMLWQVGFQLSYLAVVGIVYLHPKLYQFIKFRFYLFDKAWSITCVSLAAQLATFPLGFYYFHQFPTYFLISNLVVIPAAFFILLGSMFLLIIGTINDFLSGYVGDLLNFIIDRLNSFVILINQFPKNKIDWVILDVWQVILIYLVIILVLLTIYQKNAFYLRMSLLSCCLFMVYSVYSVINNHHYEGIVFYELRNNTAIDFISNGKVDFYLENKKEDLTFVNYQIEPNRLANYLPPVKEDQYIEPISAADESFNLIVWQGYKILVIKESVTSLSVDQRIIADFIVLSNNQNINVEQLMKIFSFKYLIINGTYTKYRALAISSELDRKGVLYWNMKEKGAFVYQEL